MADTFLSVSTPAQVAHVREAHSHHASNNPKAYYKKRVSVQDVLASRMICKPLHLLDCCTESDNATALIVTSAARARDCRAPVHITFKRNGEVVAVRRGGKSAASRRGRLDCAAGH